MFNKSTSAAITGLIRLAKETEREDCRPLTAKEIASETDVPSPFLAKLLTTLSQFELVQGNPGPNGGYLLTRRPSEITLLDIASCFERVETNKKCSFGPGYCGEGDPCPMHDKLVQLEEQRQSFLAGTTLADFLNGAPKV